LIWLCARQRSRHAVRHQPASGDFLSYLEQLFGKLRRHEIVESIRGPGGYSLARRADKVTVADIIIAVDEPLDATQCGGKENCHGADIASGARCMTHELWATLNEKMVDYLDSVSLQDLVDQQSRRTLNRTSWCCTAITPPRLSDP
jgi:Rrf2 family iron-sulfur cluster assembly transcriptional regulator